MKTGVATASEAAVQVGRAVRIYARTVQSVDLTTVGEEKLYEVERRLCDRLQGRKDKDPTG